MTITGNTLSILLQENHIVVRNGVGENKYEGFIAKIQILISESLVEVEYDEDLEIAKDFYLTNCNFNQYYENGLCNLCSPDCEHGCNSSTSCDLKLDVLCNEATGCS